MLDILSVKAANEDELLAEMERIPENLSALYADRMNKITDKKFAKKILQWLVTCRRPLTLDSLRGVDIIGRYVGSEGRFDLDRDQPPEGLGKDRSGIWERSIRGLSARKPIAADRDSPGQDCPPSPHDSVTVFARRRN